MSRAPLSLCAALALAAGPAAAHDFWIEVAPDGPAQHTATLWVGPDGWHLDAYPRSLMHARRFGVIGPDGWEVEADGDEGETPAGRFATARPGVYAVVYESVGSPITLPPDKFTEYLESEGITDVVRWREAHGQSTAPGRERFFRSAKALVRVDAGEGPVDRYRGLPLELVPEADLDQLGAGGPLTFVLLFDGRPVPDTRVAAYRYPGAPATEARTDAQGRITLDLSVPGPWLLKAVHMIPSPPRVSADWHSYWTSLTFTVE